MGNANQNMQIIQNKKYLVTLSILSFLIIVLGITNIVIYTTRNNGINGGDNTSETNNNTNNLTSTPFENLTKEEALAFLRNQTDINGTLPKDFVGEEVSNAVITNGRTIVSDLDLIYSYDTIEDLKEMAHKKYGNINYLFTDNTEEYENNNFEIKEYDYYAIVTPNRIKGATYCDHGYNSDCDSLLSFKKEYLNYYQEETISELGAINANDVYYITTQDPQIINYLLRVYVFFSNIGFGSHGNIYSYDFEEQDDKYVLIVNNVGAGINSEILKNSDNYTNESEIYGINLYRRRFAADKSDGHIYTIPTETGVMDDVKSFPITQEEFSSLPGYGD